MAFPSNQSPSRVPRSVHGPHRAFIQGTGKYLIPSQSLPHPETEFIYLLSVPKFTFCSHLSSSSSSGLATDSCLMISTASYLTPCTQLTVLCGPVKHCEPHTGVRLILISTSKLKPLHISHPFKMKEDDPPHTLFHIKVLCSPG